MCHIIFVLPFASLLLFYLLPFHEALGFFLAINAISFFLYYKIYKVMRLRPENGKAAMLGKEAAVIDEIAPEGRILIANELWYAESDERLHRGQKCIIVGFDGLRAVVRSKPGV